MNDNIKSVYMIHGRLNLLVIITHYLFTNTQFANNWRKSAFNGLNSLLE